MINRMSNRIYPANTGWKEIFENGQSLFEVVVAVGVIALVMVAVVSLGTVSVRNSNFAKNDAIATKYAQEGTECLRQQRDANWSIFLSTNGSACAGTSSVFTRTVPPFNCFQYDPGPLPTTTGRPCADVRVNMVDTIISVAWTDSQGTHSVRSATTFTKWR